MPSSSVSASPGKSLAPPRLVIESGTIEALKWIGLVLMTLDHVNKYLLHESHPVLFAAGRLAMPIFSFVLAYNLAGLDTLARGTYGRVIGRLALAGVVASVPFIGLGGLMWEWWPLNILFMLLVSAAIMALLDSGGVVRAAAAIALFLVGGAIVEFWWPAIVMTLAAWRYVRRPSWTSIAVWVVAAASLYVINRNFWALAALPLSVLATRVSVEMPRSRQVFYVFYPFHLMVLWAIARAAT